MILEFQVTLEGDDACKVVRVWGDLDLYTADDLRDALAAIPPNTPRLEIDLTSCSFIDSSGIGVLAGTIKKMDARGTHTVLRGLRPSLLRLVHLTGLSGICEVAAA